MKTNEIIKESEQLDEFGEKVVGGLKGLLKGNWRDGRAGWQGGQGQQIANRSSDVSVRQWNNAVGQLQQAGQQPTMDQLKAFVKKQAPTHTIPDPKGTGPEFAEPYIRSAVAQHIANKNTGIGAVQQPVERPIDTPDVKSPEQIRKEKQSVAATAAQQQMASNPVTPQPAPQSPEQIRQAKQAAAIQQINKPTPTRTGGKIAGQLSQTPGAIKKRQARAASKTSAQAGAGAFGQMATQLGAQPDSTAPTKVGPGVMPQMTAAPSKVTYNMPAAKPTPPAATPAPTPTEPITIGGQKILPNDPAYAKIMKAYKEPAIAESIFKTLWGKN